LEEKNQVNIFLFSAHDQITAILKATGKPVDDAQVTAVVNSLKGKKLEDVRFYLFS